VCVCVCVSTFNRLGQFFPDSMSVHTHMHVALIMCNIHSNSIECTLHTYIHIEYIHVCVHAYRHKCMYASMHACIHTYTYGYTQYLLAHTTVVCAFMNTCTQTYRHTTHTHIHKYTHHTRIHTSTPQSHTHNIRTYIHTYIHTGVLARAANYLQIRIPELIITYIHTYTYIHTHMLAYMQTCLLEYPTTFKSEFLSSSR
jgi:hypothetical protein